MQAEGPSWLVCLWYLLVNLSLIRSIWRATPRRLVHATVIYPPIIPTPWHLGFEELTPGANFQLHNILSFVAALGPGNKFVLEVHR